MTSIQLSVAEPCHEDWSRMLPEEQGRFCLSCQKTVVDFTHMTDGQIFDYFKNYKGSTCGQFAPNQLDRNIARPTTRSIGRWKYFWQILLPAVFAFHKGEGQMLKGKVASKTVCKADTVQPQKVIMGLIAEPIRHEVPKYYIEGTVQDDKGVPVAYATVVAEKGKGTVTDSTGHFSIELATGQNLLVSYIGYESKTVSFDSLITGSTKNITIEKRSGVIKINTTIRLQMVPAKMGEVVITGYTSNQLTGRVGGVSVFRRKTLFSKPALTRAKDNFPSLKIFPNPIQPGQPFQIDASGLKPGNYFLRVAGAAGSMLIEQKLNITGSRHIETVSGETLQQRGMYILNLSNPADKKGKGLTGKIVVN